LKNAILKSIWVGASLFCCVISNKGAKISTFYGGTCYTHALPHCNKLLDLIKFFN